jgi:hypothetical protein
MHNSKLTAFSMTFAFVSCLICSSAAGQVASVSAQKPISLVFATDQQGCSMQIVSTKSTKGYLFEEVNGKNTSQVAITSATFGVLLHPIEKTQEKPIILSSAVIPMDLQPGEEKAVQANVVAGQIATDKAASFTSSAVLAELGILRLEFGDGSSWSFDPETQGSFQTPSSTTDNIGEPMLGSCLAPQAPEQGAVTVTAANSSEGAPSAPQVFSCATIPSYCTYCTNYLTTCVTSRCPNGGQGCVSCPHQLCQFQ